jgi:hypothetical protein
MELGCSDCLKIPTKLTLEAIGLAIVKSSTNTSTSCIEASLNGRELILMKLRKCKGNEFVIALTTSSFALTL